MFRIYFSDLDGEQSEKTYMISNLKHLIVNERQMLRMFTSTCWVNSLNNMVATLSIQKCPSFRVTRQLTDVQPPDDSSTNHGLSSLPLSQSNLSFSFNHYYCLCLQRILSVALAEQCVFHTSLFRCSLELSALMQMKQQKERARKESLL